MTRVKGKCKIQSLRPILGTAILRLGKLMVQLALGVSFVSALLGLLVGLSSTPVAGTAITAAFGFVATGLAFYQRKPSGNGDSAAKTAADSLPSPEILKAVGWLLVIFSIAFTLAMFVGTHLRISAKPEPQLLLPWKVSGLTHAPKTPEEAVDWILVREHLLARGYNDDQIKEVFSLRSLDPDRDKSWNSYKPLAPQFGLRPSAPNPGPLVAENIPPGLFERLWPKDKGTL